MKEREKNQSSSSIREATPSASKADLQRQRRSRQLEETQRLLDGYDLGSFDSSATSIKHLGSDPGMRRRVKQEKVQDADTHSVISTEQLGRIHNKYKDSDATMNRRARDVALLTNAKSITRNGTFVEPPVLDDTTTLRGERPIEGRGRGRGRGRIATETAGSNESSLGEMSQSRRSSLNPTLEKPNRLSSKGVQSYLRLVCCS